MESSTRKIPALPAALAWLLLMAPGCRLFEGKPAPTGGSQPASVRNNTYALLYQLLDQEKDLSKLSIIKRETPRLRALIRSISAVSAAGAQRLEQFAKLDPTLQLKGGDLPAGEVSTRDSISRTEMKELLLTSGGEFELNLLLTQSSALSYGWHLAGVAARNEPQPQRARDLRELSDELKNLHRQVVSLIALRRDRGPVPPKR